MPAEEPNIITGEVVKDTESKNNLEDQPSQDTTKEIVQKPEQAEKPKEKQQEDYSEEQLIKDLKDILNASYYDFEIDPRNPDYIRSSEKYNVIHKIKDKKNHITDFKSFCGTYCGSNWEGWKYFVNMTIFELYDPLLKKEDFSTDSDYDNYIQDRVLVNRTQKETIFDVENGKVFEYKFWLLEQDDLGNYKSNRAPYILIYKIPCSKDMTVFIRPKWQDFTIWGIPGKVTEVMKNWELEDDRVRRDLLNKSNKILEACPIEKDFFSGYEPEPYFKSELAAYYWKIYYKDQINLTREVKIGAEKTSKADNRYTLKEVNISIRNNFFDPLYSLGLKVGTKADDDRDFKEYIDMENAVSRLSQGQTLSRNIKKEEIKFTDNITILFSLYMDLEDLDLRPLEVTFTKEELEAANK